LSRTRGEDLEDSTMGEPNSIPVKSRSLWHALLGARAWLRGPGPVRFPVGIRLADGLRASLTDPRDPDAWIVADDAGRWRVGPLAEEGEDRELGRLYLPLLTRPRIGWCIAHLGQALDGHIATSSGKSHYVTGAENLIHLHRMRALADVVIVGAETVRRDDPRLTTRRVPGESPVRAIIDPRATLAASARVLDGESKTLVLCGKDGSERSWPSTVETVAVAGEGGHLSPAHIIAALRARGLCSAFVEGGGRTVSYFLEAGVLDRLQVTVAPLVIGGGRPGIVLPAVSHLGEAIRGPSRHFTMGEDVLFELDLRGAR
jgi:riboflavin-specific deaminase-like protein